MTVLNNISRFALANEAISGSGMGNARQVVRLSEQTPLLHYHQVPGYLDDIPDIKKRTWS